MTVYSRRTQGRDSFQSDGMSVLSSVPIPRHGATQMNGNKRGLVSGLVKRFNRSLRVHILFYSLEPREALLVSPSTDLATTVKTAVKFFLQADGFRGV